MIATEYSWPDKVVLVVEDDISSLILLRTILSKTGVKVLVAEDGETAVKIVKDNAKIDLILMDIKLKGLNGLDATRQIKAIIPEMTVIAQTACAISGDMEKCLDAGCNAYITKPISSAKLLETIDYYFRRNAAYDLMNMVVHAN